MIGGKVHGVFRFEDRLSLAVRGTDMEHKNWVATDLPLDSPAIREGDSIWWQSRIALWTPQDGSATDVHIPRIGYSYAIDDLWRKVSERCRAGICPECANPETMHDGEGALWCGNCGASWIARQDTAKEANAMNERKLGPNTRRLLAEFIAIEAVPLGGGLASGLQFLANPEIARQGTERAIANFEAALAAVKSAPDNPYGDDDEAIAAAILERIKQKRQP